MRTEFRSACTTCGSKNNLNYFKTDAGVLTSKCLTPKCPGKGHKDHSIDQQHHHVSKTLTTNNLDLIEDGEYQDIPERGLDEQTCRDYFYQVGTHQGQQIHIANYLDTDGSILSQKIRYVVTKKFTWRQANNEKQLFGQHLVTRTSDILYITEGEIDAMSMFQLGFPNVVSISTGAGNQTAGEIKHHLEFINSFKKVVFVFDNDQVGKDTAREVSALLDPGKAYIVPLGNIKDPNEYLKLQHGITDEVERRRVVAPLIASVKAAVQYTPASIRKPTLHDLKVPEPFGRALPYPILNEYIRGIKPGRLYMVLAGAKVGKSSFTKEIVKHLVDNDPELNVGLAYLEEPLETTGQSFVALDNDVPLYELSEKPEIITPEAFKDSYDKYVGSSRIQFVDASFMDLTGVELISTLRYLIIGMQCQVIVLDHISMITYDSQGESSERKDIDILMKNLRKLAHQTKCAIITVCHLKRPAFGKSWAEGREVQMTDARGSAAFEQLCDVMIALERVMGDNTGSKTKTKVIANRITGKCGYTDELYWNEKTGRYNLLGEMFK